MPKRKDINSVMIIGAGPIVIGQACEFDYSGTQACRALREEGCRVALLNSNPATIMTDPEFADATYMEPVCAAAAEDIIKREKVDAVLSTMGGQTALNCALELYQSGALKKHGVKLIGANAEAIRRAEDRSLFKKTMAGIGLAVPFSTIVKSLDEARAVAKKINYPLVLRPSFTLGGSGGGVVYNDDELEDAVARALAASPSGETLLEESVLGWKEFEMEAVRDNRDNAIIVCSIENFDPMGAHTGDSITVAPAMTLTDREYQRMRDATIAVLRAIGVDTGGANVQFAVNPKNGEMKVIEMNPRVSRSSALASKATGFPIARVAAKLALGYSLPELKNEITGGRTPASFEPALDYVVVKAPRFAFEKFPSTPDILTTQMKSVGEAMAIGRTFCEAMQKALCSLETSDDGFTPEKGEDEDIRRRLAAPSSRRIFFVAEALRRGLAGVDELAKITGIDPWFLEEMAQIIAAEQEIAAARPRRVENDAAFSRGAAGNKLRQLIHRAKRMGFSDAAIARLWGVKESQARAVRRALEVHPVFKRVDTCAAEFDSETGYFYSTYEDECELSPSAKRKIAVIGAGPNRIGQGVEFDYCCVHGVTALREAGFETLMLNCNPETVSTDFDTADRLFFEPLTDEHVCEILRREQPEGVIVQFGGQTPLQLARAVQNAGFKILGTPMEAIDDAESRERFGALLKKAKLRQPENLTARSREEALKAARKLGWPLMARPSYVIGGRAMAVVNDEAELDACLERMGENVWRDGLLLDRFLGDALEVDVDAVSDGRRVAVAGVMEHIERAGVHSGDSACTLPPHTLSAAVEKKLARQTETLAKWLGVVGLINVQFAVRGGEVYVLEANPRASRTVPFVSKAAGTPIAKIAARAMAGLPMSNAEFKRIRARPKHFSVKEAVFPFNKLPGVDVLLGPEMKSTGEVMGIAGEFADAFYLALEAVQPLPESRGGVALFSVKDVDKNAAAAAAAQFAAAGFSIAATSGTAAHFRARGIKAKKINKAAEERPHILDFIRSRQAQVVINTESNSAASRRDSFDIRDSAMRHKVLYFTTTVAAQAAAAAFVSRKKRRGRTPPKPLQEWHRFHAAAGGIKVKAAVKSKVKAGKAGGKVLTEQKRKEKKSAAAARAKGKK